MLKIKKKNAIIIQTTADNEVAIQCYLKHGYQIIKEFKYPQGRDGYEFRKNLNRTN